MNVSARPVISLASIVLGISCASPRATVAPLAPTTSIAPPASLAPQAAPADLAPQGTIAVAETIPAQGFLIEADTVLRIAVNYTVHEFVQGQDSIAVMFKKQGGGSWEPSQQRLTQAQGQVTFEFSGAELLARTDLARPFQARFVLVSWRAKPEPLRHLLATGVVVFQARKTAGEPKGEVAKFIPPSVGKGQLISDMLHDPRYKPRLPPELNFAGSVVWGLFKLCVDSDGQVSSVQVLKSAHRLVDDQWVAILRTLQHKPYMIGGRVVPYCYPMRLEVRSQP